MADDGEGEMLVRAASPSAAAALPSLAAAWESGEGAALVMKVLRGRAQPPPSPPSPAAADVTDAVATAADVAAAHAAVDAAPPPPSPPTLPPLSLRDDQALSFSGNDRGAGTLISARSAGLCVWGCSASTLS